MYKTVLRFHLIFIFFIGACHLQAQPKKPADPRPRLIVGIVIDQMRNDFIARYWDRFGDGGFKRLVNEGFYFRNNHYNYIPTYTGPGHCSIYTGATPRAHGIIANDWFVKEENRMAYCVYDDQAKPVGTEGREGMMSPRHQLSSTIGDEMKISSVSRSKIFAVALKDRSAILPAGHAANGAFWYEDASGRFISSNWYMKQLPEWLNAFNNKNLARSYLEKGWQTLVPLNTYTASLPDENPYESAHNKQQKPVFPYTYASYLEKNSYGILKYTPYGNTITRELALECLKQEALGKDAVCDLLSVSFSSPDIIGHVYGPRSVEIEDVYLRLDQEIRIMLETLDKEVGKGNYTVFLTADHGAADVPAHLKDLKIPAGYVYEKNIAADIKKHFQALYGDSLLLANVSNEQVFLDLARLGSHKLSKTEVENELCEFLVSHEAIAEAYPSGVLRQQAFTGNDYRLLLQNGYNHQRSGHVAFIYRPGWMDHGPTGTTHGAGYNYDTHVPLIFYGNGIRAGESYEYTTITQIAPSISELLKMSRPNCANAKPLNGFFR